MPDESQPRPRKRAPSRSAARKALVRRWYDEGFYGSLTLADVILSGAEQHPHAYLALESSERPARDTLGSLVEKSRRLAGALYKLGIRGGDVVAVQLPNWIECALISQAVWLLDAVLLPITPIYESSDLAYVLNDADAKALFLPGSWRGRDYPSSIRTLRRTTLVQEFIVLDGPVPDGAITWRDMLALGDEQLPKHAALADDVCTLIYTSGTTSRPKAVAHTHNTLLAEARWGQPFWGRNPAGNHLTPWPFGHIAAMIPLLRWWLHGVNTVLTDRWDPEFVARVIERHRIASTIGLPYHLSSLLDAADRTGADISSLTNYGTGAAAVPSELVERCQQRGIYAYRIYGLTEHPTVTAGLYTDPVGKRIHTDGRCLPGCEVRILDDDGHDLPVGEAGEIATIGPDQFVGYLDPENDDDAFTADGWFLSGDIGRLDADGYLTITDRKKDIIIRGGENISSREVEETLGTHAAVAECAVVAMPDTRLGERICAYVVAHPGVALNLDDVARHFREHGVARQKTPEELRLIDRLPRNSTGKVQKHLLRAQLHVELSA